jgi:hypothetical protein
MSADTILTLANGRGIDLLQPRVSDVHWPSIAEALAKEKRFNGHTPGVEYSVAEHKIRGTVAILRATHDRRLAAYWSLHDAPEGHLKDDPTPKKRAIAEIARREFGVLGDAILKSFDRLTELHEAVIHEAAGLPWPLPAEIVAGVKHWDRVMFVTEWRDLMAGAEHPNWAPYADVVPLPEIIRPLPNWCAIKSRLLHDWRSLLPNLGGVL